MKMNIHIGMFVSFIYINISNIIIPKILFIPLAGLEPAIPNLGGWCLIH